MTEEVKTLPDGMLAEAALKDKSIAQSKEELRKPLDAKSPALLPVDPNYREPKTLQQFKDMAEAIKKELAASSDCTKVAADRGVLILFLLQRIEQLEHAVQPFATAAMMMSNTRMCLIADKRADEPAGGIWIGGVTNVTLQPNEALFFNAVDAYGRQRAHDYMVSVFERVQAANRAQAEKAAHVEAGGPVH